MRKIRLLNYVQSGSFIILAGTVHEAHPMGSTKNYKFRYRNVGFIVRGGEYEFV